MPSNINTQTDSLVGYGMDKANPGGLIENNDTIGQAVPKPGYFTTLSSTEGYTPAGDITLANGKAIKTDTTTAHTAVFQAYDVNGVAYKTFATLTNGDIPSFAIAAPSGGTVAINGAVIGGTAPAAATVTALTQTGAGTNVFNSSSLDTDFIVKAITSGNAISYDAGTSAVALAATTIGLTGTITNTGEVSQSGSTTYTTATSTAVLKQGANGKTGTVTLNGLTPVSVANSSITANSGILFTLKTASGTVSISAPNIITITAGVGFTVAGLALDVSTYNYHVLESAA